MHFSGRVRSQIEGHGSSPPGTGAAAGAAAGAACAASGAAAATGVAAAVGEDDASRLQPPATAPAKTMLKTTRFNMEMLARIIAETARCCRSSYSCFSRLTWKRPSHSSYCPPPSGRRVGSCASDSVLRPVLSRDEILNGGEPGRDVKAARDGEPPPSPNAEVVGVRHHRIQRRVGGGGGREAGAREQLDGVGGPVAHAQVRAVRVVPAAADVLDRRRARRRVGPVGKHGARLALDGHALRLQAAPAREIAVQAQLERVPSEAPSERPRPRAQPGAHDVRQRVRVRDGRGGVTSAPRLVDNVPSSFIAPSPGCA